MTTDHPNSDHDPVTSQPFDLWADENADLIDAIIASAADDIAATDSWAERENSSAAELAAAVAAFEALGGEFLGADGCVPFQAEGRYRGFVFYFRSRHDRWTLSVGPAELEVADICLGGLVIAHGDDSEVWGEGDWANPATGFKFAVRTLNAWVDASIANLPPVEA